VLKSTLVPSDGVPKDAGDFVLIMGGPMSVNDSDPWIGEELSFVQSVMELDIPILGICFGAQLLAKALGSSVTPGPIFEIGMVPVRLTDGGKKDSIFSQLPNTFNVLQWHGEGLTLPPGAVSLVASDHFPIQAFRAKDRAYGLLFHLEMDETGIQALCGECPEDVRKGGIPANAIHSQALPHLPTLHQFADRLIANLVETI